MNAIELGDKVKDNISGFTGIAVAKHIYLNGCVRYSVQPEIDKEGKLPLIETFDDMQLVVLKIRPVITVTVKKDKTGGPEKYMPRPRTLG